VILLMFDLTDRCSFRELDYWVEELDCRIQRERVPVIVVGNKCELQGREVGVQEIRSWLARNQHCRYMECSASTGQGVQEVFELANECFLRAEGR
jgi:GTPase SAR1 family protein